jgi:hypothetical protein
MGLMPFTPAPQSQSFLWPSSRPSPLSSLIRRPFTFLNSDLLKETLTMKRFRSILLSLGLLMILAAAAAAPIASAGCYAIQVQCGSQVRSCPGKSDGAGHCIYNASCLNCQ